jgi:hypothetical protein
MFSKLEIVPERTRAEEVEGFLSQIRAKDESDDAVSRLMAAIGVQPQVGVMPYNLTTTGVFMAGVGVSDATGLWWNEAPFEQRPKVRIYVDTSPSMADWRGRCVYMINCIKDELPAEMYAFAGDVIPIETEDFAQGKYPAGWSTYFDSVIKDILDNEEKLAIIFTDGESNVSANNKILFRQSDKQLYTILLGNRGDCPNNGGDLKEISEDTMCLLERPKDNYD